jgi:hypothetical protein
MINRYYIDIVSNTEKAFGVLDSMVSVDIVTTSLMLLH